MSKRKDLPLIIEEPYDPTRLKDDITYLMIKGLPTPKRTLSVSITLTSEEIKKLLSGKYKIWMGLGEVVAEISIEEEQG